MISSHLNALLSTILGLKIFVSGILFVSPPLAEESVEVEEQLKNRTFFSSLPHEDDDGFEAFL